MVEVIMVAEVLVAEVVEFLVSFLVLSLVEAGVVLAVSAEAMEWLVLDILETK
jgi:hypothetical protein